MPAAFEFEHVGLAVEGTVILDEVSLSLPAEGVSVIVGASGSGKSSLLRLCNRLEVPTRGVVRYRGDDLAMLDPLRLRRRVGMVFQRPTLFPGTVRDNLLTARPDASEDDLEIALRRAALSSEFLDRDGGGLSGGEAQRVCLARTLATEPETLLMDESTSSLDHDNARMLEETARELSSSGVTVVWVTHDLLQASRVADHTIKLARGKLVG